MAQIGTDEETKQEKKREWADVDEPLKFVNQAGKVRCEYCKGAAVEAGLKVTSTEVLLQDKPYMTTGDNNGKINFLFEGNCLAVSNNPPCISVIELGKWEKASDVHIDNNYALIVRSTIKCARSGEDIQIVHSGQVAEILEKDLLKNLRIKIRTKPAEVCEMMVCEAIYLEGGEPTVNENIQWKVMVYSGKMKKDEDGNEIEESKTYKLKDVKLEKSTLGKLEGKPLSDKKDANPEEVFKIKGNKICFNVPKEWGQKEVRFMASLNEGEEDLLAISQKIKVKDHIVAAFFRINPDIPKKSRLNDIRGAEKNYKNILGPVHHHQGLYKTGSSFYISGSTHQDVPAYVYQISENDDNTFGYRGTTLFDKGVLNYYRHSGGLQIAGDLMAIGIEEYNYKIVDIDDKKIKFGILGSAVYDHSVVCFYKGKEEKKHLRIIRDRKYQDKVKEYGIKTGATSDILEQELQVGILEGNDYASAVGIIVWGNKYIVAVRGDKKAVSFYEIDEGLNKIDPLWSTDKVGEFQNLNLHLNEQGDIYMFGMEVGSSPDPWDPIYSVTDHICKIYRVNMKDSKLESVWIDEKTGLIKYLKYTEEKKKNKLKFNCLGDTSFKWASCIHMGDNRENVYSEDLTKQDSDNGFEGKFTLYVINRKVLKHKKIEKNFIHCHSFREDEWQEEVQTKK